MFEKNLQNELNSEVLKLQYKLLFRRWDLIDENSDDKLLSSKIYFPSVQENEIVWKESKYIMQNLIEWNAGYYNHYKKETITEKNEVAYYTDIISGNKSIFEMFFPNSQPILDVKKYEVQMRASEILKDPKKINFHLIFDEVGTGKTVSALYCIRDIIAENKDNSKILIICPNNKKSEWQKDIKRQLGLYSHIVDNTSINEIYTQNIKKIYFKDGEPAVFIEGQKKGEIKDNLNSWSENKKWDLIVIDEGHQCFDNYSNLKSDKAVLLTATPIVIRSATQEGVLDINEIRTINDYIKLMKTIVDDKFNDDIKNLFSSSDVFTQIFREDLGIKPKQRNIKFIKCERLANRDEYLDVLSSVKGGMTKLIYEQDDEFLVYGIFKKFKEDIEKADYSVEEKLVITNHKYKKLVEHINDDSDKSYIIFFNSKWPADNIYEKLIDDKNIIKNNIIIAKKYGGNFCEVYPKDATVTPENILDYLQTKIKDRKRVLFLTTGASGGTGLNLGHFNGVVNYELPFTSIELEQRFGRVDRMDAKEDTEKEMVFLINEDANPMLRYSTLKINATCLFMPIRNTVLFNSDFIKANIESLKKECTKCSLIENDGKVLTEFCEHFSEIDNDKNKSIVKSLINHIIKKGSTDGFEEDTDGISEATKNYFKFISDNYESIKKLYLIKNKLPVLTEAISIWRNLLSSNTDNKKEISYSSVATADNENNYEEYALENESIKAKGVIVKGEDKATNKNLDLSSLRNDIDELEGQIENLDIIKEEQNATGVFYIKDNKYCRQSVADYRKSIGGQDGK